MKHVKQSTHTPGPWIVDSDFEDACFIGQPDGVAVASACCGDGQDMQANARLIAAAPEMLEALNKCARDIEYLITSGNLHDQDSRLLKPTLKSVLETIAKARGES